MCTIEENVGVLIPKVQKSVQVVSMLTEKDWVKGIDISCLSNIVYTNTMQYLSKCTEPKDRLMLLNFLPTVIVSLIAVKFKSYADFVGTQSVSRVIKDDLDSMDTNKVIEMAYWFCDPDLRELENMHKVIQYLAICKRKFNNIDISIDSKRIIAEAKRLSKLGKGTIYRSTYLSLLLDMGSLVLDSDEVLICSTAIVKYFE
ncbi:MAG: hypothetical protein IJ272_08950 [Clostridia bacterium]|nr:hypothetical protein [Clostridia bacterium]